MESNHQLKKFIRSTLGCNCPDEVFDRIDISSDESLTEIVVGGRLLIHLVRPNPNTPEDLFITDQNLQSFPPGAGCISQRRGETGFVRAGP
jgi:hypothetical protein